MINFRHPLVINILTHNSPLASQENNAPSTIPALLFAIPKTVNMDPKAQHSMVHACLALRVPCPPHRSLQTLPPPRAFSHLLAQASLLPTPESSERLLPPSPHGALPLLHLAILFSTWFNDGSATVKSCDCD